MRTKGRQNQAGQKQEVHNEKLLKCEDFVFSGRAQTHSSRQLGDLTANRAGCRSMMQQIIKTADDDAPGGGASVAASAASQLELIKESFSSQECRPQMERNTQRGSSRCSSFNP